MAFQNFFGSNKTSLLDAQEISGHQYGAIPYRVVEGKVVFLLITSRRSANWVFPKGSPMEGLTPHETAAEEAWEEAGVRGEIEEEPIGSYINVANKSDALVQVQLFPLLVTKQVDSWKEESQRFRHWVLLPEAKRLLAAKDAANAAVTLQRRIMFGASS